MLVAFLLELQFFLSRPDVATKARNWRRHAFGFCLFAIILIANYAINTRANATFSSKFAALEGPLAAAMPHATHNTRRVAFAYPSKTLGRAKAARNFVGLALLFVSSGTRRFNFHSSGDRHVYMFCQPQPALRARANDQWLGRCARTVDSRSGGWPCNTLTPTPPRHMPS
jgi:hypothetical protein